MSSELPRQAQYASDHARRRYNDAARKASAAATRDRILEAARNLIDEGAPFDEITLDAVARAAAVSRATVYTRFGSKAGLVEALIDDAMVRSSIQRVVRAREAADPLEAVKRYIPAACAFWETDFALWRSLNYVSGLESTLAQIAARYDERHRDGVAFLVQRVADAGRLRPGISPKRAEDVIWTLTDFHTFDHLRYQCDMPLAEVAETLWAMAQHLFVED